MVIGDELLKVILKMRALMPFKIGIWWGFIVPPTTVSLVDDLFPTDEVGAGKEFVPLFRLKMKERYVALLRKMGFGPS